MTMTIRRLIAAAGGMVMALAAAPLAPLHAQLAELRQDSRFIFDAASNNLLEIRLGQQAQSKATNPAVKQFGQQMVTDHTNLHNQLTSILSKNTEFKPGLTDDDEKEVERLEKLSGAEFERAYMTAMVQHHQEDVSTYQSQQASLRSAEARQIAANSLPVLQRHASMAVQVANQLGGVAVNPPTYPTQNPPPTGTPPTTGTPPVATPQPGPVTTQYPQGTNDISADMGFIREAGSSNVMEIRLGQLAQSRASNSAVKQFGQRMVTDHTNMQQQLTSLASSGGVSFTPALDSDHERQVNRVERFSGSDFDRAYMRLMIQAHQDDADQFRTQAQSARSVQVRNLASATVPLLEQHVSLATQVGAQVGADTTDIATGPNRPGNRNVRADAEFIRDVGADNTMQVELAKIAKDRARNRAVRQFAERVERDHNRLQDQWEDMASRNDMRLKRGMGPRHRDKVERLEKTKGNNFDRVYMTLMIQQHQDEVSYRQKEGRASRSNQVRELVNRGLPTLQQHLAQSKQIGRQVGVDPEAALRNRSDIARDKDRNEKDKDRD
jgi:putative membrane protein